MPKMPESDSKEETAESIAEKKEQVKSILPRWTLEFFNQERLKQLEAKQKEKERNEKYSKLKTKAKDERAKMRDKVGGGEEEENYSMEAVNIKIFCVPLVQTELLSNTIWRGGGELRRGRHFWAKERKSGAGPCEK